MLILPTIGRPDSLKRFVEAYRATMASLPIYVMLDSADAYRYDNVEIPTHWKRCSVPAGMRLGDIFNLIFKTYPNEDFYGMVADDVVPTTPCWDIFLRNACKPDRISWGWDSIQNEKLPVHPFIGGDLVRKLGFWAAPGIKHWFVDNAWKSIADALGVAVYLPEIKMTHHHYINGKSRLDRTYENQPSQKADEVAYMKFMSEEFPALINKLTK